MQPLDIVGWVSSALVVWSLMLSSVWRFRWVNFIGAAATETIHELALAVRHNLTVEHLAATIHGHPTFAEAVGEAARCMRVEGCLSEDEWRREVDRDYRVRGGPKHRIKK